MIPSNHFKEISSRYKEQELMRQKRVLGGRNSNLGMFPHQISIQTHGMENSHFCGGSIIASKWVLSATHCFLDDSGKIEKYSTYDSHGLPVYKEFQASDFDVVAGLYIIEDEDEHVQRHQIDQWYFKEDYGYSPQIKNDITLLKTKQKFFFNYYVQPGIALKYSTHFHLLSLLAKTGRNT